MEGEENPSKELQSEIHLLQSPQISKPLSARSLQTIFQAEKRDSKPRRLSQSDLKPFKFDEDDDDSNSNGSNRGTWKRRNQVSITIREKMQHDPVLAEHFEQLETPIIESIQEVGKEGLTSEHCLLKSSRVKRTTDAKGIRYVNQYIVIKLLGRGTFGKVQLCLNTMDCKLYAVKTIHRKRLSRQSIGGTIGGTKDDVGKGAMREIAVMKKLHHPNIVALIEVIDDPSNRKLYLVLEYVERGPIMSADPKLWHPILEDHARLYFRDMCQGLDYLHHNKIVHRDLKPGNLLHTIDGGIKISDFGVSHMFEHESDFVQGTTIGTPAFLAPEICLGGECQGRAADVWALGVCLYVMVMGEIPFPADSVTDMYDCIIKKKLEFSTTITLSSSLKDLLMLILTKDPNVRITLAGIMHHEWVSNGGLEPLVPFKLRSSRISTSTGVSEDDVNAAIKVKAPGLKALSNVNPVEKQFDPGEYIMRQGEEGKEMYLIVSGECEVLVESRSLAQPSRGRMEYAIAERGPGEYIGEMALNALDAKRPVPKRTASIRAKTHVLTLVVSREQVIDVLSKNSEAAQSIADTIAERDLEIERRLKALEIKLPSFRQVNIQQDMKVSQLGSSDPSHILQTNDDVAKPTNLCLGCRIV